MLSYVGAGFLLLGVLFLKIGAQYGLILGIFIILVGLILSILSASGRKDEQEVLSV